MAAALPGGRLRPHVKAHKCTALAALQASHGHHGFTCATTVEAEGLARAGLGDDLLLANEVVDVARLRRLARSGARVTVAVDSEETIVAAATAGVGEVVVDVNVGLPRCGCAPEAAGRLAEAPGPGAWRCEASWGTRATSWGWRTGRDASRWSRSPWRCSWRPTTSWEATSSRPAGPAPTTSTRGRPRSRPARTRSWTAPTPSSRCPSARP